MNRLLPLSIAATMVLGFSALLLVVEPYVHLTTIQPERELVPYSAQARRGRAIYVANGCMYCHSQQPRDRSFAPDFERGWGRAPTPGDYAYDAPHQLGTMRTGPDLFNIGARQPSRDWHLTHLYQPRAVVPESIMPAYPFLFEVRDEARPGDVVVQIPGRTADEGVVVATREALDLVAYLLALDHTYPSSYLPQAVASANVARGDDSRGGAR